MHGGDLEWNRGLAGQRGSSLNLACKLLTSASRRLFTMPVPDSITALQSRFLMLSSLRGECRAIPIHRWK